MSRSYYEKLARIDLTAGTVAVEPLELEKAQRYIGGRGLGTKILYDEGVATVDPLGPDNKLVYITGPMTGTPSPSSGRYMVCTKSPLTGMIACSNSGGIWGAKLKHAGWDGLIVEGVAKEWTYLLVDDGEITFHSAEQYVGMKSEDMDEALRKVHGEKASVLNIGPAGEHEALLAAIINDKDRAAGRSGVGAVMGSKKLKAIVVKASVGHVTTLHDEDALKQATSRCLGILKENGVTGQGLRAYGTAVLVNIINNIGSLPTKNWQESYFEQAEDISGEALAEKYLVKNSACARCPIACGRVVNINGKVAGGPEYEPLWAYGSNCGNNDLNVIDQCNMLCNEYGLDAIGVPCTIAAAMELYQRGAIKEADCAGVPLEWGSAKALVEWTKRMGNPETELDWLMSSGSARLCEHYGMPEVSMSVKKQEMPAYDARGIQGIGVTYATSNRGGCHVRGYMISPEVLGLPTQLDRTVTEDEAVWAKTFQDLTALIDSTGVCLFTSFALGLPEFAAQYREAVGSDESDAEILLKGERVWNLEKKFNIAAGVEKDTLPPRLLREQLPDGPAQGKVNELHTMLQEYYQLRGWDTEGIPTPEKDRELGL